jgi:hypothetical protein
MFFCFLMFSLVEDGSIETMFLFIVFVSYLIGCISTIVILICLYIRFGLYPPGTIVEQKQYQTFHPLPVVSLYHLPYVFHMYIFILESSIKKLHGRCCKLCLTIFISRNKRYIQSPTLCTKEIKYRI